MVTLRGRVLEQFDASQVGHRKTHLPFLRAEQLRNFVAQELAANAAGNGDTAAALVSNTYNAAVLNWLVGGMQGNTTGLGTI